MLFVILLFCFLLVRDTVIKFKGILLSQTKINWLKDFSQEIRGTNTKTEAVQKKKKN